MMMMMDVMGQGRLPFVGEPRAEKARVGNIYFVPCVPFLPLARPGTVAFSRPFMTFYIALFAPRTRFDDDLAGVCTA